ncbi:MAG: AI-2E family transporter [Fimbriimonadaceae bacterium]
MGWRIALWIGLVVLTIGFLYLVRGVLMPFVLAFIISALLDPSIRKLRMRGWSKFAAIGTPFAIFFIAIILLIVWLTPTVGGQLTTFRNQLETLSRQLRTDDGARNVYVRWNPVAQAEAATRTNFIDQILTDAQPLLRSLGLPTTSKQIFDQYIQPQQKQIANSVEWFFAGFVGLVSGFASQVLLLLLTPLIVAYMLADMDRFKRRGALWIPPAIRAETVQLLSDIGGVFVGYLRGITTLILVYITGSSLMLTILGVPYGILLGILFGAIYLIPYIGAAISLIVTFLVVGLAGDTSLYFIQFSSPWMYAAVCAAFYFCYDRVFDSVVYPRMVGKSVGLNPVVSMFVVLSGAALFGIVGMLLAFPVAGAVKVILDRLIRITSTSTENLDLPAVPLRHRSVT